MLVEMSSTGFAQGNDAEAERGWREALHLTRETQGTFFALEALVGMAALKVKQGNIKPALELVLIVLNHPASLQETKNRAKHLLAELEERLTPTPILEAIRSHAAEKTFDAVVEDLLK